MEVGNGEITGEMGLEKLAARSKQTHKIMSVVLSDTYNNSPRLSGANINTFS